MAHADAIGTLHLPRRSFRFPSDYGSYTTPVADPVSTDMSAIRVASAGGLEAA